MTDMERDNETFLVSDKLEEKIALQKGSQTHLRELELVFDEDTLPEVIINYTCDALIIN